MRIPVGVVGYGNLGKAVVEKLKNNKDFELVAIFSRRKLTFAESLENIEKYKNKIKLLFLCVGSQNELQPIAKKLIQNFEIVDSFDNHNQISSYIKDMEQIAKQNKKIALCSVGWDPGLFSLLRSLYSSLGFTPYTFWGKGLSQGHTQAIKNIDGVYDAIQFTIPDENVISQIKKGIEPNKNGKYHKRQCFVVAEKSKQKEIEQKIKTMKDYFVGYDTEVNFVSQSRLNQLKSFAHKGEVLCKNNVMDFKLNIASNPEFTANIMTSFAKSVQYFRKEQRWGAYNILNVPISYLLGKDQFKLL